MKACPEIINIYQNRFKVIFIKLRILINQLTFQDFVQLSRISFSLMTT